VDRAPIRVVFAVTTALGFFRGFFARWPGSGGFSCNPLFSVVILLEEAGSAIEVVSDPMLGRVNPCSPHGYSLFPLF